MAFLMRDDFLGLSVGCQRLHAARRCVGPTRAKSWSAARPVGKTPSSSYRPSSVEEACLFGTAYEYRMMRMGSSALRRKRRRGTDHPIEFPGIQRTSVMY